MRFFILAAIVLGLACEASQLESSSESRPEGSSAAPLSSASLGAVAEIDPQTLLGQTVGESLVLDVRTPEEYAAGHVPHAINVPHDQVGERLGELEARKTGPVVVYCKSGRRAGLAAAILERAGFTNLHHLTGDMDAWTAAGLPIEQAGS